MGLLAFLLVSAAILGTAYAAMRRLLLRLFPLSAEENTPAHTMRDGLDYEPASAGALLPQHFSAIAAAGPIVGPILAGFYFGWIPAWIWLIAGSILIGGIHDFVALLASVRHRARSIAEIVREYMNPRAYFLFLFFIWTSLIYVVIAFTDVTAATFAAAGEGGAGPAVATSSILYLGLALAMGLVLRRTGMAPWTAKLLFLPLVFLAIPAGTWMPLDVSGIAAAPQKFWGFVLLAYCFAAALAPVWLLLQPRGELGGYFLYIVIAVGVAGIAAGAMGGSLPIAHAGFKGFVAPNKDAVMGFAMPLFPILFITVACGACSGFHSIVATGTTSKQLRLESDALPIGYGSMLLEAFFACISLATLMVLAEVKAPKPDAIYSEGIALFASRVLGLFAAVPPETLQLLKTFAALCFATFVFDTLDACTRLARYVLMEMLGWTTRAQAAAATAITLALPVAMIAMPAIDYNGRPQPLWRVFWTIFGASNQLLAALALLCLTVWLARTRKAWWLTFFPAVFMMAMTVWSLVLMVGPYMASWRSGLAIAPLQHLQFGIILSLLGLSGWLCAEAGMTLVKIRMKEEG